MGRRLLSAGVMVAGLLVVGGAAVVANAGENSVTPSAGTGASGTLLRQDGGLYPRAIRLQHSGAANGRIIAGVVTFVKGNGQGAFYESTDDGTTFTQVGTVAPPDAANGAGLCCGSLLELPQQVGDLPAGTLLWAASVGAKAVDRRMSLQIWRSSDISRTWSYLSSCYVAGNAGGLWEPELSVDTAGRLVCYFSDETEQPSHSQTIRRAVSSDGVNWGGPVETVAGSTSTLRPGMPTVRRLPDGTYLLVYEVCGDGYGCAAYLRKSVDGSDWGAASNLGTRITTVDGKYFAHAPTVTWLDNGTANGRLLLVGQMLYQPDGTVAPGNGKTVLVNTEKGTGGWYTVAAPVVVPDPYADPCPNYSSTLVPSMDGARALEIATSYDSDGVCKAYFTTGSILGSHDAAGITSGKTYRLVNVLSRLCLDVSADSRVSGGNIQQWTCNNLGPQNFNVTSVGGGYYTLKGENSKLCVDVKSGSVSAGANVQQWTCNGTGAQAWRIQSVGNNYYTLVNKNSGVCLDVQGGSTSPGGNVWQWYCNSQSPQIWNFQAR